MITLIKKDFDIRIYLILLTVGIAISLLITIMIIKIIESKNTVQSVGGDGYYWLQAPKGSYELKLNEEVKIPIKICTPDEFLLEEIKKSPKFKNRFSSIIFLFTYF